jgi:hypothetical protein
MTKNDLESAAQSLAASTGCPIEAARAGIRAMAAMIHAGLSGDVKLANAYLLGFGAQVGVRQ